MIKQASLDARHSCPGLPPTERQSVPLSMVVPNPFEPRKDPEVDELFIESCRPGLINPITVWFDPVRDIYPLICGQRRWLAALKLQWSEIDALVCTTPPSEALAAIMSYTDNATHKALNAVDDAEYVAKIAAMNDLKQCELAKYLNISPPGITRKLRLANAPPWLKELVRGGLAANAADTLLELKDEALMLEFANRLGSGLTRERIKREANRTPRAKSEHVKIDRPGNRAIVLHGCKPDTPIQDALELVRALLADLIKAGKKHSLLGDAVKAWRTPAS